MDLWPCASLSTVSQLRPVLHMAPQTASNKVEARDTTGECVPDGTEKREGVTDVHRSERELALDPDGAATGSRSRTRIKRGDHDKFGSTTADKRSSRFSL